MRRRSARDPQRDRRGWLPRGHSRLHAVVVTADGDEALAQEVARDRARVWDRRDDFRLRLTPAVGGDRPCAETGEGPVLLADGSDNPAAARPVMAP